MAVTPRPVRASGDSAAQEPRVIGRYRLVKEQGTGLFGTVWLAEETASGQPVALRLLPRELTDIGNVAETIRRRSRAIVEASRAHPGLVGVLEYGATEDGTLFAVMERVEGQRLSEMLAARSKPDVPGALRLAVEMGGPVETLHNMGLLHGGLWPRNFAVADGRVTLMDVETIALRDAPALQHLVAARGPAEYLAPEQIEGRPITEKTDVYIFGAGLYEMVAGRPPFEAPTREAVLEKHLNAPPPILRRSRRTVSLAVEATLMGALEKRPESRPFMPNILNHIATEAGTGGSRRWRRVAGLVGIGVASVAVVFAGVLAWSVIAPRWADSPAPPEPTTEAKPAAPASTPPVETRPAPPAATETRTGQPPADPAPKPDAPQLPPPPAAAPPPVVPPPGPQMSKPMAPPPAAVSPPPPPPSVAAPSAPVVPKPTAPPPAAVTPAPPPPSVAAPSAPIVPKPTAPPPAAVAPTPQPPGAILPAPPVATPSAPAAPKPVPPPVVAAPPPASAPPAAVSPPPAPRVPEAPPVAASRPPVPRATAPSVPAPQAERPRPAPATPAPQAAPAATAEPDAAEVIDWLLKQR